MIRPYRDPRPRPLAVPVIGLAVLLLLIAAGSGEVVAQTRLAHAVTQRPVALVAPACPIAERRP